MRTAGVALAMGCALLSSGALAAGVYRCTDSHGAPVFSDRPCNEPGASVSVAVPVRGAPAPEPDLQAGRSNAAAVVSTASSYESAMRQRERAIDERKQKAAERKNIHDHMDQSAVRERIGEPDARDAMGPGEVWTYRPTPLDPQMLTRIQFNAAGNIVQINRIAQR